MKTLHQFQQFSRGKLEPLSIDKNASEIEFFFGGWSVWLCYHDCEGEIREDDADEPIRQLTHDEVEDLMSRWPDDWGEEDPAWVETMHFINKHFHNY